MTDWATPRDALTGELVLEVSPMRSVSVDGELATIGAGVRLGELYDALVEVKRAYDPDAVFPFPQAIGTETHRRGIRPFHSGTPRVAPDSKGEGRASGEHDT